MEAAVPPLPCQRFDIIKLYVLPIQMHFSKLKFSAACEIQTLDLLFVKLSFLSLRPTSSLPPRTQDALCSFKYESKHEIVSPLDL